MRNNTACNLSASLAPAIEVFWARCDRRATPCCSCDLDLRTAVDELQEAAVSTGLVAELGQDAVQRMMAGRSLRARQTRGAPLIFQNASDAPGKPAAPSRNRFVERPANTRP